MHMIFTQPESRPVTPEEARTLNLLGVLSLGLVDGLKAAVESKIGYGGEIPAALVTLGSQPGISVNALSKVLGLSHPGTVRLVDRLTGKGLAERRSGSDGRTLAIVLTDAGLERRATVLTARRVQAQGGLHALAQPEKRQLTRLLEKMLAAMTTDEACASSLCRLCEEEVCPQATCPVEQQARRLAE